MSARPYDPIHAFQAPQMPRPPISRPFDVRLAVFDVPRSSPTTLSVLTKFTDSLNKTKLDPVSLITSFRLVLCNEIYATFMEDVTESHSTSAYMPNPLTTVYANIIA